MKDMIKTEFEAHKRTIETTIEKLIPSVETASQIVIDTLKNGKKGMACT